MNPRATTAFALVALAFATLPVHADDTAGAMWTAARTACCSTRKHTPVR
jgi:hypothetical protein